MSEVELAPVAAPTLVQFRPMLGSDRGFFAKNWLGTYRRADPNRGISKETYFYFQHRILEQLLRRSKVVIACDEQDPDKLYGFACFENRRGTCVLHYVYVRGGHRKLGIGSALLAECLRACADPRALVWTHRTRGVDRWIRQFVKRTERELALLYNPYLIHEEA